MKRISSIHRPHRWLALLCCLGLSPFPRAALLHAADPQPAEEPAGEEPAEAANEEGAPEAAEEAAGDETETEAEPEEAEAEPLTEWYGGNTDFTGWLDFTGGGAIVSGNEAEFQRRFGLHDGGFGGASSFHWEKYFGKTGLLAIEGKAFAGNQDYDLRLNYTDTEKGYLRFGYQHGRTWDTGTGGLYPLNDLWYPLDDTDLHLDRERFWVVGGLTLPNWPEISLQYAHETRRGQRSSTIWGTTQVTPGISGIRNITASFRDIDETRDVVEAAVSHTFGNTAARIDGRYERSRIDNSLNQRNDPGTPAELYATQKDHSDSDLFHVHATSETRLNDKWMFTASYGYTSLDTDFTGSRIYGIDYDPVYNPSLARHPGFIDLVGGSQLGQHVGGLNLAWRPTPTVVIVPSVRLESTGLESESSFLETPSASTVRNANSDKDFLNLSERLEARYTGLKNWVLYARGDWAQGNGDLTERLTTFSTGVVNLDRDTDLTERRQKYTAGANWYPLRRLNFSTQYYYKENDYDYDHLVDSTPNNGANRYPAYLVNQNFNTHDVNFRVTFIPVGSLVAVSRYDYQTSRIDTTGDGGSRTGSADIQTHIFSQSLSWNPFSRLYLHGTFSYVTDETETPANELATVGGLAPVAQNDFWQATFGAGFLIDDRTEIDAEYTYSEADNYEGLMTAGVPYGASYQEHRAIVTVTRRVSENLRVLARYGWFTNDDQTYGGFNDYTAHLVWGSVQYRF